jgi:hypothetical protein
VTLHCVIAGVFFESRSFYSVMRRSFQILQFILFLFLLLLGDPYGADSFSRRWIFLRFPAHRGEALIPLRAQGRSQLQSHHALSMCGLLQRLTSRCAIFAQRAIVKTLIAGGREQADNACRAVGQPSGCGLAMLPISSCRCNSWVSGRRSLCFISPYSWNRARHVCHLAGRSLHDASFL